MGVIPLNIFEVVNRQIRRQLSNGVNNLLIHIIDSDDTSLVASDHDIALGIYRGEFAAPPWEAPYPIDFPFTVVSDQVTAARLPDAVHRVEAEQREEGLVITKAPGDETTVLEVDRVFTKHNIYNFMLQTVFDLDSSSTPQVPSDEMEISDTLHLPEQSGVEPMGLICGAIDAAALNQPVVDADFDSMQSGAGGFGPSASFCCKNYGSEIGTKYRACEDGVLTDECDSTGDIIQQGCTVCLDVSDLSDITAILETGSNCDLMDSDPDQCFRIINGIDFDVDTDADGENDAWSAVFGFDTRRARIVGLTDP